MCHIRRHDADIASGIVERARCARRGEDGDACGAADEVGPFVCVWVPVEFSVRIGGVVLVFVEVRGSRLWEFVDGGRMGGREVWGKPRESVQSRLASPCVALPDAR